MLAYDKFRSNIFSISVCNYPDKDNSSHKKTLCLFCTTIGLRSGPVVGILDEHEYDTHTKIKCSRKHFL